MSNGRIHWNPSFIQAVHDWELESMDSFLKDSYSTKVNHTQEDRMIWTLSKVQGFKVSTYYKALRVRGTGISLGGLYGMLKLPCVLDF